MTVPPETGAADGAADGAARLAMALRLDEALLAEVGGGLLLTGLGAGRGAADGEHPGLALAGGDGTTVARIHWTQPLPGTALLRRGLPVLALVTGVATLLVLAGIWLARRGARRLVIAEARASAAARTDGLTGLPNRQAFNEALAAPSRAGERALLFLDLGGFKRINDSIGHAAGDAVIVAMAARLRRLAGPGCALARIGGDDFVFVVTGRDAEARTATLVRAVDISMQLPFEVGGHQMHLRAAMGYAVQQSAEAMGGDLVRQADLAVHEAKRRKDGAVAFGDMIDRADRDARAIERALRRSLGQGATPGAGGAAEGSGLSVAYQPIVDVATGRLARAEALARWTSVELGPVPPDRFVAVAERSGLVVELGRQFLSLVCDDLALNPSLNVSVNVSPLQLMAPTFLPDLVAAMRARGLAPGRVEVELTESVVVDDPDLAARRLAEMHEAGFRAALDDFGTGYSSIGYLRRMAFDAVKVDRSFVSGLAGSPSQLALVESMIALSHALGLAVVCEGVETEAEMAALRRLGCDFAQGYHLDGPLPIDRLLAKWDGAEGDRAAVA